MLSSSLFVSEVRFLSLHGHTHFETVGELALDTLASVYSDEFFEIAATRPEVLRAMRAVETLDALLAVVSSLED